MSSCRIVVAKTNIEITCAVILHGKLAGFLEVLKCSYVNLFDFRGKSREAISANDVPRQITLIRVITLCTRKCCESSGKPQKIIYDVLVNFIPIRG